MTDLLFPPWLRVSSQRVDPVSNTAGSRSVFSAAARTVQRAGDRMRFGIRTENASNRNSNIERAKLMSIRAQLRGQGNRIWYSPVGYSPRGSFPATEKLDSTFANGTTGWTTNPAYAATVSDRVYRATRLAYGSADNLAISPGVSVTQYAPYVARFMAQVGIGSFTSGFKVNDTPFFGSTTSTVGMVMQAFVPNITTDAVALQDIDSNLSGTYVSIPYASYARCMLVDNGSNLLLYSDQFENAAWSPSNATIAANSDTAPDGTTTADGLVENGATSAHYVFQSVTVAAASADFCFSCAVKIKNRNWVVLQITETTGSTSLSCYFNASTGAIGTTTTTGANWSGLRSFAQSMGNGWYQFSIVGRKTNAATTLQIIILAATADGTATYTGGSFSSLTLWRATLAQSSVPVRLAQTTSAATTGTLQSGNNINVKGLPASTNGLLLESDYVQIGQQLVPVASSLNSDAAGLGTLQLAWPLRNAPANDDPVIINTPMGKFILTENTGGWDESPGIFSNHDFVLEEALDT